jgi:hypothetical protein
MRPAPVRSLVTIRNLILGISFTSCSDRNERDFDGG